MTFIDAYLHHYKKLLLIPLFLFILTLIVLTVRYQTTGDIIEKDVSLKGGISATIHTTQLISAQALEEQLTTLLGDTQVRTISEFGTDQPIGISLEVASTDEQTLTTFLEQELNIKLTEENFSIEVVGSSLGASFYQQMVRAIIFAFLFMAVVVFITFRKIIPSIAIVLTAMGDILTTIAVVSTLDIHISTSGISALLLLIGYSIDTDVLLTTRVLKRQEGDIRERFTSSMKTGLTMTATTFIALFVAYFITTSDTLKQMFLLINIGLIADIIYTYLLNGPLLLWYIHKKQGAH